MKSKDEQLSRKIMGSAITDTAFQVTRRSVYSARTQNEKLSSIHFRFGVLLYRDSSAAAILQLNGCDLNRLVRLLSDVRRNNEGPFDAEFPMSSCSQDSRIVMETARALSEHSRDCGINTTHLLLALYSPEVASGRFLKKTTPSEQIVDDLKKVIRNQDMRHIEG